MRYADVLLLALCRAVCMSGEGGQSAAFLNKVRCRAGLTEGPVDMDNARTASRPSARSGCGWRINSGKYELRWDKTKKFITDTSIDGVSGTNECSWLVGLKDATKATAAIGATTKCATTLSTRGRATAFLRPFPTETKQDPNLDQNTGW